ncbi:uncharacterized protein [Procambarus clarkii]|uniref:uncharacterized protein n=1 Tax=Procambarus clarkii TaxID=6728 RepID=UPI001E671DF2|nr:uncharacterized protein LOC123762254 [Procambarus clarkii]
MATNLELQPLQSYKEIDQQWLKLMLSKKFGCSIYVHSWSSTLPEKREGFLSEIAFVNVKYTAKGSNECETQLVFKFLPQDADLMRYLANGGLARREVEFYQFAISPSFQEMLQKCGLVLPIPEVYYTGYKEDAVTIVLRDLSVDKYKSVIVKDGSTLAQTKTALQAVAVLHAAGVLYLQQNGKDNALSYLATEFKTNFCDELFISNLKVLARMFKESSLADTFSSLIPLVKHIHSTPQRYPLLYTIVHGDLWAGQLLFSDDESTVSIIDWQFCHIGTPVSDIMSMLFMSSDPKILKENLGEVLENYWCTFYKVVTAGGASVEVSLEELSANVEEMWMYGFMFLAVSIMDFLNGDSISDYRVDGALRFLEKKGVFKKFLEEFEH